MKAKDLVFELMPNLVKNVIETALKMAAKKSVMNNRCKANKI